MNRSHHRQGFTLVELLVVIGIIALLVAILLPTLQRARESAIKVSCLSNIRQINTAQQFYANEFDFFLTPPQLPGYWKISDTRTVNSEFSDPPFLGQYSDNDFPAERALNITGFIPRTAWKVWSCPDDRNYGNTAGGKRRIISYAVNIQLTNLRLNVNGGPEEGLSIFKLSQIDEPSRTAVFVDGRRQWQPGNGRSGGCHGVNDTANTNSGQDAPGAAGNYRIRHSRETPGANVAFVDGSARFSPDLQGEHQEGKIKTWQYDGPIWAAGIEKLITIVPREVD